MRAVSSLSTHHPQEVLLAQFSLHVHSILLWVSHSSWAWRSAQRSIIASCNPKLALIHDLTISSLDSQFYHFNLHPLQAANCCRNSRLVVDDLKWVSYERCRKLNHWCLYMRTWGFKDFFRYGTFWGTGISYLKDLVFIDIATTIHNH